MNEQVGQREPTGGPESCQCEGSQSRDRTISRIGGGAEAWSLVPASALEEAALSLQRSFNLMNGRELAVNQPEAALGRGSDH